MSAFSIKSKMILVVVLVAVALSGMTGLKEYSTDKILSMEGGHYLVSEIKAGMLQLRKDELDFLRDRDLGYVDRHQQHYADLVHKLDELKRNESLPADLAGQIVTLSQKLETYQKEFSRLVGEMQILGLDEHYQGLHGDLQKAEHALEKRISGLDDLVLTKDYLMIRRREKDFLLRHDVHHIQQLHSELASLSADLDNSRYDRTLIDEVKGLMKNYEEAFAAMARQTERTGLTGAEGLKGELEKIAIETEDVLLALSKNIDNALTATFEKFQVIGWLISLLVVLAVSALITVIAVGILKPIGRLAVTMKASADNKNLGLRIETSGNDEISVMSKAFNSMMDAFEQLIGKALGASVQLSAAAEELSAIAASSAQGVEQQQSQVDQVATAMHEMQATVQEVARNAETTASSSNEASNQAENGLVTVNGNVDYIRGFSDDIQETAATIETLGTECESIGGVLNVIRSIAEQTNLLALNAAIEAARAGEQGRGFAVVADEVRTLAQRSQESTQEIEEIINKLQSAAAESVRAVRSGQDKAAKSVGKAEQIGGILGEIASSVQMIGRMNTEIASAAEEQAAVSEEINRNVTSISDVARASVESMSQTGETSRMLAELAVELEAIISEFELRQANVV